MKKLSALALSIIASGALMAADYSKSSNKDLINLAGKVSASDIVSYNAEIEKRVEEMTMKEARDFREQIRTQESKVYDAMKVKDFKAYRKSIDDAMRSANCCGKDKRGPQGFAKKGDRMPHNHNTHGAESGGCGMMPPPPPTPNAQEKR